MNQLMLLPESTENDAAIGAALTLLLSWTSTRVTERAPWGSIFHCVPGVDERRESRLPAAPCRVSVPVTVCVWPAWKVSVAAVATVFVRLWKVVLPMMVWLVP